MKPHTSFTLRLPMFVCMSSTSPYSSYLNKTYHWNPSELLIYLSTICQYNNIKRGICYTCRIPLGSLTSYCFSVVFFFVKKILHRLLKWFRVQIGRPRNGLAPNICVPKYYHALIVSCWNTLEPKRLQAFNFPST